MKRQYNQLSKWLAKETDIEYMGNCMVVLTNSNAIVKVVSDYQSVQEFVVKSSGFPFRVEKLLAKFTNDKVSWEELEKLSHLIKTSSVPRETCILTEFGIKREDILPGVYCCKCEALSIRRKNGRWVCIECKQFFEDAQQGALDDFYLLFGNELTTKEFTWFLQLGSTYIGRFILKSMGLKEIGNRYSKRFLIKNIS